MAMALVSLAPSANFYFDTALHARVSACHATRVQA